MTGRTGWRLAAAATIAMAIAVAVPEATQHDAPGRPSSPAAGQGAPAGTPALALEAQRLAGVPGGTPLPGGATAGADAACPPGWCDAVPGRVLIKVAGSGTRRLAAAVAADLRGPLASYGVGDLVPVFPHATPPQRGARVFGPDGSAQPVPDLTRWFAASIREGADPKALADNLRKVPGIEMAEPEYLRRPIGTPGALGRGQKQEARSQKESRGSHVPRPTPHVPDLPAFNDPLLAQQWHLNAVNAPAAWAWLESQGLPPGGARGIVVAVIDTGVDYLHPDLAANIWTNAREVAGNGIDDDANGYVDDVHGIDATGEQAPGNPADNHGHGTHVAGIIAAQADNGAGGVGVAWNVQVMPLKAAQYSGVLATSHIAQAIVYATEQGADVINMSFGGYVRSTLEEDALTVAFGQAVLVAAAGNDGMPNEPPCAPNNAMYPAAYNWVLGVMASNQADQLAGFSNHDCTPQSPIEYEVMAPGVDVWSTLPNGQFAAWDGTSMAAPIVSGIAALARTHFADKDTYSSRFIMGQVASNAGPVVRALDTLTVAPSPSLSYLEHWTFDSTTISAANDGDGRVDAGETIELALVIRNHWGKADPVSVTLDAWAGGAIGPDPFITWDVDTVDYGAVGSFNWDDNGLIYDTDGYIIGVRYPFRFTVDPNTPNDHIIPFRVTMTAGNGYDPAQPPLTFTDTFTLMVQRGRELPRVISSDMTLTKDDFWIVEGPTLIEPGVTVRVGPGTRIQWGTADPNDPYAQGLTPYIQSEGTLIIEGTFDEPVDLIPSEFVNNGDVMVQITGNFSLKYARVNQPWLTFATDVDHAYIYNNRRVPNGGVETQRMSNSTYVSWDMMNRFQTGQSSVNQFINRSVGDNDYSNGHVSDSVFLQNAREGGNWWMLNVPGAPLMARTATLLEAPAAWGGQTYAFSRHPEATADLAARYFNGHALSIDSEDERLFVESYLAGLGATPADGTVVELPGDVTPAQIDSGAAAMRRYVIGRQNTATGNAFLSRMWDPNLNRWMRVQAQPGREWLVGAGGNYWGTTSRRLIDESVYDYFDNFDRGELVYEPVLEIPAETTYPFAWNVLLNGVPAEQVPRVGAEAVEFTVLFNRDMDTSAQPLVSFGPDVPFTDYTVHRINGGWQDARTWKGTFNIGPITGDGYQLIRIAGARAADDPWLVAYADEARFRFEVVTSGTEAMSLQAFGAEGSVQLSWVQDDFDLMAGYNVYRSTSASGPFSRLNPALVPPGTREFVDTGVQPGVPYYYTFTVVKTDFTESAASNVASATPTDTIAPVITHTPVAHAAPGLALTLAADVTDNVRVTGATLFYRAANQSRIDLYTPGRAEALHDGTRDDALHDGTRESGLRDGATASGLGQGPEAYAAVAMTNTTGNRFAATIPGASVQAPGLEYYLEAQDGVSVTRFGEPSAPLAVSVTDRPVVTAVSPARGPAGGGTPVVVAGANFKVGATVAIGGVACAPVTRDSENQLRCTTGAHLPTVVDVSVTNPDAATGTLLRGFTYEAATATVGLPHASGRQGAIVQVPLSGTNVTSLAAALIVVTFDPAQLQARRVLTGTLTTGWTVEANLGTPGRAIIGLVTPSGTATGTGSLAHLEFDVTGSPGATAPLHIETSSLNDGALPAQTADGSFTIDEVVDVGGRVTFWNTGAGVPGVTLSLSGSRSYTADSDATGAYRLDGVQHGSYVLTPGRTAADTGIGAFDASLTLRHAVELITLTGAAATAADVNRSGSITPFDAYLILQYAAGLIPLPFPNAGIVWEFSPATRTYPELATTLTDQDFTAILLGDVSGNWSASAPTSLIGSSGRDGETPTAAHVRLKPDATTGGNQSGIDLREAGGAMLALPSLDVAPGAEVVVPITITPSAGAGVTSAEITITFDPAVVSVSSVAAGALTPSWLLATNLGTPGVVRIAAAGAQAVSTPGEFLRLAFTAIGTRGQTTALTVTRAELNEGAVAATTQDGALTIPVCTVAIDPASRTVAALGGGGSIAVAAPAGCGWTASTAAGWITVTGGTVGTGDGTVTYTAGATELRVPREAVIDVGGRTHTVTQPGLADFTISGAVTYWSAGAAVPGTTLTLTGGAAPAQVTTGAQGGYSIGEAIEGGTYTLTPSKADAASGISAFDASLVLRHAAGLVTLTGHALTAADVNRSSSVTAGDASAILQYVVGLAGLPFAGSDRVWDFAPGSRTYDALGANQTGQDFTAVLLGDATGNWSASAPTSLIGSRGRVIVTLPRVTLKAGATVEVPIRFVTTGSAAARLMSAEFDLVYDPAVVVVERVAAGAGAPGWTLAANTSVPGVARIALASAGARARGDVVTLTLRAVGARGATTALTPGRAVVDDGRVRVETKAGFVRLGR